MQAITESLAPVPPPLPAAQPPPLPADTAPARGPRWRRLAGALASAFDRGVGFLTILVGLAVLSVVPVLNLLSLGYLFFAAGRVASSGRLRSGMPGIRQAAVAGRMLAGAWLVFLPVRFVAGLWRDAELIAPGASTSRGWHAALIVLTALGTVHVLWACIRGGQPWHFLWPAPVRFLRWIRRPEHLRALPAAVVGYVSRVPVWALARLGLLGLAGTLAWLIPPGLVLAASLRVDPAKGGGLLAFAGSLLLMVVLVHLPLLQARFAVERRFRAFFEVREVRALFRRAPIAVWFSLFITVLFSIPLYLLRVELPPREIVWLPSLLFVVFLFPARLLVAWAVGRGRRRELPRHVFFRWLARLGLLPVAFSYALIVYLAQYISWDGSLSLLQQHAFLLPGMR